MAGDRALTVVVPTLDRCDLLGPCLASLAGQTYAAFDVLVVDDGSTEDIAGFVRERNPEAQVLRRDRNGGFAQAVNSGIRVASTPFVMLLNNDMTLEPDCLDRLMAGLEGSGAAMACPLVLFRDEPTMVYSAGDRVTAGGRPESIGFRQPREGFEVDRAPWGVSAGAAIYRCAVFETVGLFDEGFVAYFEDADLCWRARNAGFEAVCVPEAVAYHVGAASLAGNTLWRTRQCYRNHALLVLANCTAGELLRRGPAILGERWHQTGRLISAYRADAGLIRALGVWIRAWGALTAESIARLGGRRIGSRRTAQSQTTLAHTER